MPKFDSSVLVCKAIKTRRPINSIDISLTCNLFPFKNECHHVCIPMNVGGQSIGVVCLLINKNKGLYEYEENIAQAIYYINEALPILQAKRYAHYLKEVALIDQLTGLFNRRYLDSYLEILAANLKRRDTNAGLLMCDIDYFKEVNDKYGHDAGDEVLRQLASILKSCVRTSDVIVRFGGEEFLIILTDCECGKEIEVAEKIRKTVEQHNFRISGAILKKTVSIGTCTFPYKGARDIWETIKFADVALYKAKNFGRNRVVAFKPEFWKNFNY